MTKSIAFFCLFGIMSVRAFGQGATPLPPLFAGPAKMPVGTFAANSKYAVALTNEPGGLAILKKTNDQWKIDTIRATSYLEYAQLMVAISDTTIAACDGTKITFFTKGTQGWSPSNYFFPPDPASGPLTAVAFANGNLVVARAEKIYQAKMVYGEWAMVNTYSHAGWNINMNRLAISDTLICFASGDGKVSIVATPGTEVLLSSGNTSFGTAVDIDGGHVYISDTQQGGVFQYDFRSNSWQQTTLCPGAGSSVNVRSNQMVVSSDTHDAIVSTFDGTNWTNSISIKNVQIASTNGEDVFLTMSNDSVRVINSSASQWKQVGGFNYINRSYFYFGYAVAMNEKNILVSNNGNSLSFYDRLNDNAFVSETAVEGTSFFFNNGKFIKYLSKPDGKWSVGCFAVSGTNVSLQQEITPEGFELQYPQGISINGDWLGISYTDSPTGAVFLYHFNGTTWELVQKIDGPHNFGYTISVSDGYAAICTANSEVTIWKYDGALFQKIQTIKNASGAQTILSGSHLEITAASNATLWERVNDTFIKVSEIPITYWYAPFLQGDVFAHYTADATLEVYRYAGGSWILSSTIPKLGTAGNGFSIAMDGDELVFGDPYVTVAGAPLQGEAFPFIITPLAGPHLNDPIPNQFATAGKPFAFSPDNYFSDLSGGTITYTISSVDGSALPAWLKFDGATLTGTPSASDVGQLSLICTATDGISADATFDVIVGRDNAPYSYSGIDSMRMFFPNQLVLNLDDYFTDPDGDSLTYTVTLASGAAAPAWIKISGKFITFTPPDDLTSIIKLNFIATDPSSLSAQIIFTFNGIPNRTPVSNPIPDQTAVVGIPFHYTLTDSALYDPDNDMFSIITLEGDSLLLPFWLKFYQRSFFGIPPAGSEGELHISLYGIDPFGDGQKTDFTIYVIDANPNNMPPVTAGGISAKTVLPGKVFSFTISPTTFTDPNGDRLSFSATMSSGDPLPAWLTFNTTTLRFTGTPPANVQGTLEIKITATDPYLTNASATFAIIITNEITGIESDLVPYDVFPNPSKGLIAISGYENQSLQLNFISSTGVVVKNSEIRTNIMFTPALEDGLWIVLIKDPASGVVVRRRLIIIN